MVARLHWMLILVAGLALTACGKAGVDDIPETLGNLGSVEGAVLGKTLAGDELRLGAGALAGKAVILNYFSSGWGACRREFPDLAASARELGDGVVVVTLTTSDRDDEDAIKGAMNDAFAAFVVGHADSDTQGKLRGFEGGGRGNPYTVFIDAQGQVREVHRGAAAREYFTGVARKMTGN